MKWVLSSIAPPYFKDVGESEDIFRTTYTAFRFMKYSGSLQPNENHQVAYLLYSSQIKAVEILIKSLKYNINAASHVLVTICNASAMCECENSKNM